MTSSRSTWLDGCISASAWRAAPSATTSSGCTPLQGSRWKWRRTASLHRAACGSSRRPGSISRSSSGWTLASASTLSHDVHRPLHQVLRQLLEARRGSASSGGGGRGAARRGVEEGKVDVASPSARESSIFALSAASLSRWSAMRSLRRSTPCSLAKPITSHSMMRLSKSSPPR